MLPLVPLSLLLVRTPVLPLLVVTFAAALASISVFLQVVPFAVVDFATFTDPELGFVYDVLHSYQHGHMGHDESSSAYKLAGTLFGLGGVAVLAPLAVLAFGARERSAPRLLIEDADGRRTHAIKPLAAMLRTQRTALLDSVRLSETPYDDNGTLRIRLAVSDEDAFALKVRLRDLRSGSGGPVAGLGVP